MTEKEGQKPLGVQPLPSSKEKERRKEYLPCQYKHHLFLPLHPHLQCHCSPQTPQPAPVLVMDQRHNRLESASVYHRLFNFISKTLESQVLKLMVLFWPLSHALAICHRLFNFTMQAVAAQAVKPVILGQPADRQPPSQVPSSEASASTLTSTSSPMNVLNKGYREIPVSPDTASEPSQEKGLKKSVSINDRVEEIPKASKSKKKKAAPEKLASQERDRGEEPKPLKSILKVGSNSTGKSVSFTIPPNDAKMDGAQG